MAIEKSRFWIDGNAGNLQFALDADIASAGDFVLRISKYRRVVYEFRKSENQIVVVDNVATVAVPDNTLVQTDNGIFDYKFLSVTGEVEQVQHLGLFYIRNHSDDAAAPVVVNKEAYSLFIEVLEDGQASIQHNALIGAEILSVIRVLQPLLPGVYTHDAETGEIAFTTPEENYAGQYFLINYKK